jgi:hypothetical protein
LDIVLALTQVTLTFYFHSADAMRLVPMKFGQPNPAISQTNSSNSLPLAPTAPTVLLSQASDLTDSNADGDRLDVGDLSEDFEPHPGSYSMRFNSPLTQSSAVAVKRPV